MDKRQNAKISIIVPIYKVEKELDTCVQSLLGQTYRDLEILLVDDGSPDACPEMCDDYAARDDRVRVIHQKNAGLSAARNSGLRAATGEYVMYVDSDDYIELNACEHLLAAVWEDTDLVVGVIRVINGGKTLRLLRRSRLKSGVQYSAKEFIIGSIQGNEFYTQVMTALYSRRFLLDHDLFFKTGIYYEDHEIEPRLYLSARYVVYVDEPFYNYVIRPGSIMTSAVTPEKVKMSLDIWSSWLEQLAGIEDRQLRRYMNGILVRFYLWNCRDKQIIGWKTPGIDFRFAMRYALNARERAKVLLFELLPGLYIKI